MVKAVKEKIRVAEFPVSDCGQALNDFAETPFKYEGKTLLCQCDFRESVSHGKKRSEIIGKPVLQCGAPDCANAVGLTPGICSSFAVWPSIKRRTQDLMELCQNEVLRPQFVFLALNWSAQLSPSGLVEESAGKYLAKLPRWSTWHGRSVASNDKQDELEEPFGENNPFRGGYMTDFVKGMVDSNSGNVWDYLCGKTLSGGDKTNFEVFLTILRNELHELDKAFGIACVPKYLIVFGPTIYHRLQSLAGKITGKKLDELFPDRIIARTQCFYGRSTRKRHEAIVAGIRTLHFENVRSVEDFDTDGFHP